MQSLGQTSRLPRLISKKRSDGLSDLRPGREIQSSTIRPNTLRRAVVTRRSRRLPIFWPTMSLLAICAGVSAFMPPAMHGQVRSLADSLAVSLGLAVDHVAVVGHNHTSMREIADVLTLDVDQSLLAFDSAEVRRKLGHLPWVETARVSHILPDMLSIEIVERLPFAVWQSDGIRYLVDRSGKTLSRVDQTQHLTALPLVVGKGAGVGAGRFLDVLRQYPGVAERVTASVRVADRRWNLKLSSGEKILLPESNLRGALATLAAILSNKSIRNRTISLIDLRIPERPTLRLNSRVGARLAAMTAKRRAAAVARSGGAS